MNFMIGEEFPKILHPVKYEINNSKTILNEGNIKFFAKPFNGKINKDTKIVILEQTSNYTYHYNGIIEYGDIDKTLESIIDESKKIGMKNFLANISEGMHFSEESLNGFISGPKLTEEEKILIHLEDEFNELNVLRLNYILHFYIYKI